MLEPEIVSLDPDIVTYYGGHNDFRNVVSPETARHKPRGSLFLSLNMLKTLNYYYPRRKPRGSKGHERRLSEYARAELGFKTNLLFIAGRLRERGVRFIVITQKLVEQGRAARRKSYAAYSAGLTATEARLGDTVAYRHYPMMRAIGSYAEGAFSVLDGIGALDGHEDCFISHVHLAKACNAVLAGLIAPAITLPAAKNVKTVLRAPIDGSRGNH